MAGRGERLSEGGAAEARTRSSAHLGATLRSILIAPTAGFRAALRSTERRAQRGESPAEGRSPYILAAVGGAALMVLWLKLSALAGLREGSTQVYRPSFLAAALSLGVLLGVATQLLWGGVSPTLLRVVGGDTSRAEARLVWGASFFPQVFTIFLLLPIDLLVARESAFTDARPEDAVAAAWAALSLSIAIALAAWSMGLLVKGLQISSEGLGLRRAALGAMGAIACVALIGVASRYALVSIAEAAS